MRDPCFGLRHSGPGRPPPPCWGGLSQRRNSPSFNGTSQLPTPFYRWTHITKGWVTKKTFLEKAIWPNVVWGRPWRQSDEVSHPLRHIWGIGECPAPPVFMTREHRRYSRPQTSPLNDFLASCCLWRQVTQEVGLHNAGPGPSSGSMRWWATCLV